MDRHAEPFGYHGELARTFRLANEQVRVIVPDFGSGFGGKHTGEAAVEAARLAQAAGRPVSLRWTREEEFTWAYFRPAAVIEIEASLDAKGSSPRGTSSISIRAERPSIRPTAPARRVAGLWPRSPAAARLVSRPGGHGEQLRPRSFMDELAAAAGTDPLDFRLAHLDNPRLRAVLEEAARVFVARAREEEEPDVGVGLACGTEKGSFVAACVEVVVDRGQADPVRRVCEVFECGAVLNPDNLMAQVQGCIIMGLGPALREEMRFENGKMLNANFTNTWCRASRRAGAGYSLAEPAGPASAGGGETPIIAIAPAIANAVFHATGVRVQSMPIHLPPAG